MGVQVRIVLYATHDAAAARAAAAAFERLARLEDVMSSYRPTSELRRLGDRAGESPVKVSEDLFAVLRRAQNLARETHGAFDVTVGPYIALWKKARECGTLPDSSVLEQAHARTGWQKIRLDSTSRSVILQVPGMKLNLGGIAKGYMLDRALAALSQHGVTRALIKAGGDIVVSGPPPHRSGWTIAVPGAGPNGTTQETLAHAAISTSGDTEQFVEINGTRYSHIIDPRTGLGLTNRVTATVIAPDGLTADPFATALSVLGRKQRQALVAAHPRVSAHIRSSTGTAATSP